MLALFIAALIGSFSLSVLIQALRVLGFDKIQGLLKQLGPLFFYRTLHRLSFGALGANGLALAIIIAKFLTLFVAIFALAALVWEMHWTLRVICFFVTFFAADLLPRIYASAYPSSSTKLFGPVASLALFIALPINLLILKLPKPLSRHLFALTCLPSNHATVTEDVHSHKLLRAATHFKDRIVREVMVPRINVFSLPHTTTVKKAASLLLKEGYSRVPVYKESIDSIVGILMYKDILGLFIKAHSQEALQKALEESIESIIKPPFYTPETKKVSQLLQEFRSKKVHLAIVVDEYGGTEGIVTIEDILEEIVGDIADEYDEEAVKLFRAEGTSWVVDARMTILDIEEQFGLEIPQDGDYDTLGGYIYHKAGAIPKKGFRIYHDDFELEVLSATDRAVEKVRITPRPKLQEKEE